MEKQKIKMTTKNIKKQPLSATSYAIISLVSFTIGIFLLLVFIFKSNDLIASGIDKMIFYILLIPLGLSAAAFLFGVMRSYAAFTGKSFRGTLELGGPVVLFALVVIGGFYLVPDTLPFSITVYIHGSGGNQDVVIRNEGKVMIDLEDYRRTEPIRENGEATFTGIPAKFRNQVVPITVIAEGFELTNKKNQYELSSKSIYVEVKRDESLAKIFGIVRDADTFLEGVQINIGELQTTTDERGYFVLEIPVKQQKKQQSLIAIKDGYKIYEVFVYPEIQQEIRIILEKKQD